MTTLAERIILEKAEEFPHWSRTFRSFLEISFNNASYQSADEADIWMNTEIMYAEILDTLIRISGVRDDWEGPLFFPLAVKGGLEVIFHAKKNESRYVFGTDEFGFFLSTDLSYAENIRKMNDDFWYMLSELSQLGELDLWENIVLPDSEVRKEPYLHRKSKSKIYSLIRNSIALEKHYGTCEDLDSVIVRWKYDTQWKELLEKGAPAFKNLYKINYELWRKRRKTER